MVETPAQAASQHQYAGVAITSLILGIVAVFIPFLGALLGIAAIIMGGIVLAHKTNYKPQAIVGVVTGGVAILITAGILALIGLISGAFPSVSPERDAAVTAQVQEKKDFTQDETAKVGPIDFKVTKVQRNYTPTDQEKSSSGYYPDEGYSEKSYGGPITEDDAEYVAVDATASVNGSPSLGDNDYEIAYVQLNSVDPLYFSGANLGPYDGQSKTVTVHYVYRIRKGSDDLTLRFLQNIWTKVSPIVGTEGMPSDTLMYTIKLK